jgi:hypothetical protein
MMWLKLFQAAINLLLKFTHMPEISDEPKFRDFCKEVVLALKDLAAATPIDEDDQAVAVLDKIVHTDTYWAAFYRVLLAALELVLAEKDDEVKALVESDPGIAECCDDCQCDKHLICRLLQFITRVWHALRHR